MINYRILLPLLLGSLVLAGCATTTTTQSEPEALNEDVYVVFDRVNGQLTFRGITNITSSRFTHDRPVVWVDPVSLRACRWYKPTWGFRGCRLANLVERKAREELRKVLSKEQAYELVNKYDEYQDALTEAGKRHRGLDVRRDAVVNVVNNTGWKTPDSLRVQVDFIAESDRPSPEFHFDHLMSKSVDGFLNILDQAKSNANASFRAGTIHRMKLSCRMNTTAEIGTNFSCPKFVDNIAIPNFPKIPVTVTVLGREYIEVTPPPFQASNEHLDIKVEGDAFIITNKTSDYIDLSEITLYLGDDVTSKPYTPPAIFPPNTYAKLPLTYSDFGQNPHPRGNGVFTRSPAPNDGHSRKFISRTEYENGSLKYGYAVGYKRREAIGSDTLYNTQKIPLSEAIQVITITKPE